MALFKRKEDEQAKPVAGPTTQSFAEIISTLTQGAAQQELAAKRLSGLTDQILDLEAGRREAERLEVQVRRLTDELEQLEVKTQSQTAWAAEQSAKYKSIKEERDIIRRDLDEMTVKREKAQDTIKGHEQSIEALSTEVSLIKDQEVRQRERAELVEHERARLSETIAKRETQITSQATKITELERSVDDLTARLSEKSAKSEASSVSLREARIEQTALKEKLIEAMNALQSAEYRISREDRSHKDILRRREEEAAALRRQIEKTEADLAVKTAMGEDYDRDMSEMRRTLQSETERAATMEARLKEATEAEDQLAAQLAQATLDFDKLSAKFSDALLDIEALRKVNLMQKKTLDRYAEIGGVPQPKTHVSPEPTRPIRIVTDNDKMAG